ncbi:MAG: S8 family serine peptidase [Prolixibacteraceae bacterium]|nr:S8 family serine peptidase [Prolixibacteraceae bacterium]
MKKLILKLFAVSLLAVLFFACNELLVEEQSSDDIELKSAGSGRLTYIVVLNDADLNAGLATLKGYEMRQQAVRRAAERVIKRAGVDDGEINHIYGAALHGFSIKIPPGQLKKLQDDPSVKYVEENQVAVMIDPKARPGDGDVQAYAQSLPWGIARVEGGASYTGTKKAWIIDTGIDLDHPDLNVNNDLSTTYVPRTTTADDDNGHGSHVAGTVAAKNNDVGVVGVAAGAELVAVKVLDRRGSGSYENVILGIDYVAANAGEGDVANMSLGGPVSQALDDAVIGAAIQGVKFALAAGNESDDANNHSPARAEDSNIYTISAMGTGDVWAYFSNYGNPPVDYCEPGVDILSCYKGGAYATMSGTSMAAPHMAGILLWGDPRSDREVLNDPDGESDAIGVVGGTTTSTGSIGGTVYISGTTDPISGATISISNSGFTATSGGDGKYSIANIPVGTYTVTVSATGYTSQSATGVTVSAGSVTNQNFNLEPVTVTTYTISGSVKDETGAAINEALVKLVDRDLSSNTDANGNYSIDGVAQGDYQITASADGFNSLTQDIFVNSDMSDVNFTLGEITVGEITLSAVLRKVRGWRYVDLTWEGATSGYVDIKVNGSDYSTVENNGSTTLDFERSSGTFTFQICETEGTACSNIVTLIL